MSGRAWIAAGVAVAAVASSAHAGDGPRATLAVGDFDGDGKPDVAVGLPNAQVGKQFCAGEVRIYACTDGRLLGVVSGEADGDSLGTSLAAVGDIDGDGATDLAIGSSRPRIDFVSGKSRTRIRRLESEDAGEFAEQLCALGDGSGGTRVDLVVRGFPKGAWRHVGTGAGGAFGAVLPIEPIRGFGCVGDVDGDGRPDFAVTTWNFGAVEERDDWSAPVFSGARLAQGGDEALLQVFHGTDTKRSRPWDFVESAGDWDGDGRGDVLVGVDGDGSKASPWTLHVFSGRDGKELWKASDPVGGGLLGGVAVIGDSDGDGRRDVAVAMPWTLGGGGAVAVVSAKTGAALWTARGTPGESLGLGFQACADVDGDGVADLVVLAPGASRSYGSVRILSGKNGRVIRRIDPLTTRSDGDIVMDETAPKGERRAAARRLVEARGDGLEGERWLGVLEEWLRDASAERAEIIELLGRLWRDGKLPPKSADRLKGALMDAAKRPADAAVAESDAVLEARYAALVALQSGVGDPAVVKLLWSVAKDEADDVEPRVGAVRGLSEGGVDDAATVPDWTVVARSKDQDVRQTVADNLFRAKAPEFDAVLEPLLFDAKELTRAGAVESQTKRRRPTMLARFDELIEDRYEYVRFNAMFAAGVLKSETSGQPQRVAMILRLLETSDEPVDVTGALLAMTMLTGETFGVKPTDVHVREQYVDEAALAAFIADKPARKAAADKWRAKFSVDCVWTDADRAKTLTKLLASADPANVKRATEELALLAKPK
jgi:hypothetical protein